MTHLTESRDALAKALFDAAFPGERETDPYWFKSYEQDWYAQADALVASGAVIPADTLADLLPDECWVLRSQRADLSCVSLIGGTFPNGGAWTEEMCCLPCRITAALTERGENRGE